MDDRAIDLLKAGDTAIIVFTHGDNFRLDPQTGHGETGNWKISTDALEFVNKIIIYHRPKGDKSNHNHPTWKIIQVFVKARSQMD